MAAGRYNRDDCIALLCAKQTALSQNGETRYPRRSDFSDGEVEAIKAFLGPWPRALEAAGLKEPSGTNRLERNREKRRLAARRKREEKEKAKKAERLAVSPAGSQGDGCAGSHDTCIKKDGGKR
ncbi:MAG: hypothetical protein ACI3XM_06970 [Eubacteriales bacterium]